MLSVALLQLCRDVQSQKLQLFSLASVTFCDLYFGNTLKISFSFSHMLPFSVQIHAACVFALSAQFTTEPRPSKCR